MKATLNPLQIDIVWQFADLIKGKDPNSVRQDCLGAEIHREDYEKNTPYGWCAEYVLDSATLSKLGASPTNILCQANIRILQLGNYTKNAGHAIGHYEARIIFNGEENELQHTWQVSEITDYGKSELQKAFSLSKEQMDVLFQQ